MINDLWYKNAIIYCLSIGTYLDADGDGIGDFRGLMSRLDYLQGLGVTALWLMPFQPSPGRDDGYDVADYYGVNPRFGTLGDFVEFTKGCNQRGLRVMIDLVVNHTSDQHPWFQEARRDPKSRYRDWYVWSKKKPKSANKTYQKQLAADDPSKIQFQFYAIDEPKIRSDVFCNEGLVLVPRQVVQRLKNDDQLAAVLADGVAFGLQRRFGETHCAIPRSAGCRICRRNDGNLRSRSFSCHPFRSWPCNLRGYGSRGKRDCLENGAAARACIAGTDGRCGLRPLAGARYVATAGFKNACPGIRTHSSIPTTAGTYWEFSACNTNSRQTPHRRRYRKAQWPKCVNLPGVPSPRRASKQMSTQATVAKRTGSMISRQLDVFAEDEADLIAACRDAERKYDKAPRDEAESTYGDYVDFVETATEALADMRDRFKRTLDEDAGEEYEEAFNRAVKKRWPPFGLEIDNR